MSFPPPYSGPYTFATLQSGPQRPQDQQQWYQQGQGQGQVQAQVQNRDLQQQQQQRQQYAQQQQPQPQQQQFQYSHQPFQQQQQQRQAAQQQFAYTSSLPNSVPVSLPMQGHGAPAQTPFESDLTAAYYHHQQHQNPQVGGLQTQSPSQAPSPFFMDQQQQQQMMSAQHRQQRHLPPPAAFLRPSATSTQQHQQQQHQQQPAASPSPMYARSSGELPPMILSRGAGTGTVLNSGTDFQMMPGTNMGMNTNMNMNMNVNMSFSGGNSGTSGQMMDRSPAMGANAVSTTTTTTTTAAAAAANPQGMMSSAVSGDYYLPHQQNRYSSAGGYGEYGIGAQSLPSSMSIQQLQTPQQQQQKQQQSYISQGYPMTYTTQAQNYQHQHQTPAAFQYSSFASNVETPKQVYDRVLREQLQQERHQRQQREARKQREQQERRQQEIQYQQIHQSQQKQQISQPQVQLYATPPIPHRIKSHHQQPKQPQYQGETASPHTPVQQIQPTPFKKPIPPPQSQTPASSSPSLSSSTAAAKPPSFPKVEVQIFRNPSKTQHLHHQYQTLQHPMSPAAASASASAAKTAKAAKETPSAETKRRVKKQSIVSLPAREEPATPPDPSIDYQTLLLYLADEYFDTAHGQGSSLAAASAGTGAEQQRQGDVEEYYRLIATGLGCLEVVLKSRRLPPQVEAIVRLRYALVLYEETENDFEAESTLTKGIDLCERNQLLDLKYTMQHLLARTLFKSNPKASLKAIDNMIAETEAYHNHAWEYAFRFLRASLSLSSPYYQDHASAMQNLRTVSTTAQQRGDKAVCVTANVLEALAYLQSPSGQDTAEQAQRCLAQARTYQLDEQLNAEVPHLSTMLQLIDIMISLHSSDSAGATSKLPLLQATMDENLKNEMWRRDGVFFVPVASAGKVEADIKSGLVVKAREDGTVVLTMGWLSKHDLYALSYYVSAVILSGKTVQDAVKAEKFLKEGLGLITDGLKAPVDTGESLTYSVTRLEWKQELRCNMLLQSILIACAKSEFEVAKRNMKALTAIVEQIGDRLDIVTRTMVQYVRGVIAQSTGNLDAATAAFQDPIFDLEPFKARHLHPRCT
ncbi:Cohesin loading factor [Ascosphaera apis ARSEF 7405]|uniref:Cohesin loading factor n=1 Tax=Ascosphaera apis ARSEF 7405 TaxID=392613 RepID=A0A166N3P2_9EURO|nr:Cohesin loading factor [Ascosphaera apis ARSEF 7405]